MIDLNKVAGAAALHMAQAAGLEEEKVDQLRYGLEIIMGMLIKGTVLFSLAYLLNIVPQVAMALAAASLFRLLSGGGHCTGYWRCLVLGVTIYLFIGVAAANTASLITLHLLKFMAGIVIIISTACTVKWAPGEVPYRVLKGKREINMFKTLSLLYLLLWAGLIIHLADRGNSSFMLAALLALAVQTISFTPRGYGLVARADGLMIKLTGKGGETNAFADEIALHSGNIYGLDHSRYRH